MKKVAVFGKPGGGKSTLAKTLSEVTGLPLFQLDSIEFTDGGVRVSEAVYYQKHREILATERWLIDGLGYIDSFRERISAADTLVFVDLPLLLHFWWVTKRLIKSPFVYPEGWPPGSPILKSTFQSWVNLYYAHKLWTPQFRQKIANFSSTKNVYILESPSAIRCFLKEVSIISNPIKNETHYS